MLKLYIVDIVNNLKYCLWIGRMYVYIYNNNNNMHIA